MDMLIVTGGISLDVLIVALIAGRCASAPGISRTRTVLTSLASSAAFLLLLSVVVATAMLILYLSR